MPGIPTEILAEQLEASNLRLTQAIEDLPRRTEEGHKDLARRIDDQTRRAEEGQKDLARKMEEGQKDLARKMEEGQKDLARKMEEGQKKLARRIDDQAHKMEEGQKEFIAFRLEVTDKLAAIGNSMSWIRGIAALVLVPSALAITAFSYAATDRAARIEESIVQLREHAREQDTRIGKILEMRGEAEKPRKPRSHPDPSTPTPKAETPKTSGGDRPAPGLPGPSLAAAIGLLTGLTPPAVAGEPDRIAKLQADCVADPAAKKPRAYHFGSQGPGNVFSNHASHSNRMVPVYLFGRKGDLKSVMGEHSRYRDPAKIKEIYGFLPENTVNPKANYADQSDLYRVQKEAVERGVKHLFIVWFDGMDWPTTQAAAIAKTGKIYTEGKGAGLVFQDYDAGGASQFGYVVTSPTHGQNRPDINTQTVVIPPTSMGGGYDAMIAGPNPWTLGPLGPKAPGYLKGSSANADDRAGVKAAGRVPHAYTDSSQSAAEMISGVKSYNNSVNVADDGRPVTTLFHQLQEKGWKVGTVTSVPFDHASPAAMYAQNVDRDDYQDLARTMLGLPSIMQETHKAPLHPGLDVVIGTGYGTVSPAKKMARQGKNWVPGHVYIADPDLAAIDVRHGGKYVVVHTETGANGGEALQKAARMAARGQARLFGLFGRSGLSHLPFQTADGGFNPVANMGRGGKPGSAEVYSDADRREQPTLAQMTDAALTVLTSNPSQPFALFIEAGDVDFGLHANNLDNAIGAVYSGEVAIRSVIRWVETHSNWDDSMMLVSSDHGHYLVIDDPHALAGK